MAGRRQFPQATLQHQQLHQIGGWWRQQAPDGVDVGIDLLQTTDQQPLAEAQGGASWGDWAADTWGFAHGHGQHPATGQQGGDSFKQFLGIGCLQYPSCGELQQNFVVQPMAGG